MKIQTYSAYEQDGRLELPLATLAPRFVQSIDRFAEYLAVHAPEQRLDVLGVLSERTVDQIPTRTGTSDAVVSALLIEHSALREQEPDLVKAHVDLLIGLMGVEDIAWVQTQTVSVLQSSFIRTRYLPNYLKLLSLVKLLPRDRAVALMKGFLDWSIEQMPTRADGPTDLTSLRELQVAFNLQEAGMDWTSAIIGEHQYLNKVTRCRIRDVLLREGEADLMDVVACYPDYAMFRHTNPSFVLTRTQTLMSGGDCCDSCYHDCRYVPAFEHPSPSVFEGLPVASAELAD